MMTKLATLVLQHGTIHHHKVRPESINKKRVFILAIGELKVYPFPFPSTITKQGLSTGIIIRDHQDVEGPSQLIPEVGTFLAWTGVGQAFEAHVLGKMVHLETLERLWPVYQAIQASLLDLAFTCKEFPAVQEALFWSRQGRGGGGLFCLVKKCVDIFLGDPVVTSRGPQCGDPSLLNPLQDRVRSDGERLGSLTSRQIIHDCDFFSSLGLLSILSVLWVLSRKKSTNDRKKFAFLKKVK
jgi:hypothetical protein